MNCYLASRNFLSKELSLGHEEMGTVDGGNKPIGGKDEGYDSDNNNDG
jgi:hypothetical protein